MKVFYKKIVAKRQKVIFKENINSNGILTDLIKGEKDGRWMISCMHVGMFISHFSANALLTVLAEHLRMSVKIERGHFIS